MQKKVEFLNYNAYEINAVGNKYPLGLVSNHKVQSSYHKRYIYPTLSKAKKVCFA